MKAIFCGNLDYDARQYDIERLFKKYGNVERVDMKSGFAFVYMEDERDAEDAIRRLDRIEFGRKGRRIRVEWTKQERETRKPGGGRRPAANARPSKTLFVINFDPIHTRSRDLERHFEPYGKIVNIRIRRNFAFIQFESEEEATRALEATNMSTVMDRVITVEFAIKDDDDRRNGLSPDRRGRDMPGRGYGRRSPSPYRGERGSPDYGYRRERGSPDYGHRRDRGSPDYGNRRERGSPDYGNRRDRGSPDYGKRRDQGSPDYSRRRDRDSQEYGRRRDRDSADIGRGTNLNSKADARRSPGYASDRSPANGRYNSRSPPPRDRSRSRERSPPPRDRLRGRPDRSPERSPPPRERSGDRSRERSLSPGEIREESPPPRGRSYSQREESPFARERSYPPRDESPLARERSYPPRDESPVPRERSYPPRDESPVPRERSRSRSR